MNLKIKYLNFNILLKNSDFPLLKIPIQVMLGCEMFIWEPIFKLVVAHFRMNLVLNIDKKIFA